MAAFAAAVKIDTFAYLPVQDFEMPIRPSLPQNYGAGNKERIRRGTKESFAISTAFSLVISALVFAFAAPLMQIFVSSAETAVIASGVRYLRIEGAFYFGNRLPVPALRILQGDQEGGDVCGAYSDLSRNPCVTCLRASATSLGETGNLDGDPDRLDTGRSHWNFIHEEDLVKKKVTIQYLHSYVQKSIPDQLR